MRLIAAIVLGMTMALGATAAVAQDKYPSRPVKFVQGFPAGGNADAITRVLGAELSKGLGQPVVSEARVGAGGNIAAEQIARGTPDGIRYAVSELALRHRAGVATETTKPAEAYARVPETTTGPYRGGLPGDA